MTEFAGRSAPAILALLGALAIGVALRDCDAGAHDSWISSGAHRNAAGEWCCGENDCDLIPSNHVQETQSGYLAWGTQVTNGKDAEWEELIPYSEAQPSLDGEYWRCKRADGSRRCFFAPPPNT